MAKKTAKTTPKKPAAKKAAATQSAQAAGTAPIVKPPAKKAPVAPKTSGPPALSVTSDEIGYAAGAIWSELHGKSWTTLAAVKKAVDFPPDVTTMGFGWLAREGKLDFLVTGRTVKVMLK